MSVTYFVLTYMYVKVCAADVQSTDGYIQFIKCTDTAELCTQDQDSQALIQGPRGQHLQRGRGCRGRRRRCRRSGPPGRYASAGAAGAGSGGEVPAAPAPAPSPVGKAGARGAKRKTTQADAD